MDKENINSEKYWDNRFKSDWDENSGDKQSEFFMNLMYENLPGWLIDNLAEGIKVCDWGCAEGDGTQVFAKKFKKSNFTGIDFAETAIKQANSRYKYKNLELTSTDLLKAGVKNIKHNNRYDVIFASNILEHFTDPWSVFDSIAKHAKDAFVIMVPFREDPNNLHFEHFHSFDESDFSLRRGEWILAYCKVIDTSQIQDTKWNGQQIVAIYIKKEGLFENLTLDQINLGHAIDVEIKTRLNDVDKKKKEVQEKNEQLESENTRLSTHIHQITTSKRWRVSSGVADIAHSASDVYRKTKSTLKKHIATSEVGSVSATEHDKIKKKILESGYFDSQYYLDIYSDVADAGIDPLWHYVELGGAEQRNPSQRFDGVLYALKNGKIKGKHGNLLIDYLDKNDKPDDEYSEENRLLYERDFIKDTLKDTKQIVVMQIMPWIDDLMQRPQHLAMQLAEKGVGVVYIEDRGFPIDKPKLIHKNIVIVQSDRLIDKIADLHSKKLYYWLFSTSGRSLIYNKKIKSLGFEIIYDYIDDIHEDINGDIKNQLEVYENLDLLKPALLIASANELKAQLEGRFVKNNVLLAQNAVTIEHFDLEKSNNLNIPSDIHKLIESNKPIVGYYGAMAPWLDYGLINSVVQRRQDLNFVFIGPDYNGGLVGLEQSHMNMFYLGPKEYKALPNYSTRFDCAIIPFKKGDIAKSTSPVKLFEYMAMGLPTVCTKDLNECRGYEYVYMSESDEEFSKNLDLAIKAKKNPKAQAKLLQYAKQNTWEARVEHIYQRLLELEG